MKHLKIHASFIREGLALTALVIVHLVCLKYFQHFALMGAEGSRWTQLILSFLPTLFLFCLFHSCSNTNTALFGASATNILLSVSHWTKLKLTNEPLIWSDFSMLFENSVLPRYLRSDHIILVTVFLVWISWILRTIFKLFQFKNLINPWSFSALLLIPLLFFPKANLLKLTYHQIDWRANVKLNGLLLHLVQTSQKPQSLFYSETEKATFDGLLDERAITAEKPQQIIFILCESCWYDETHFKDLFQPLLDRGFQAFRGVSPIYGGGTPNATFEILTGLPSITEHLKGILYQEYATSLSKRVYAISQYLHEEGYTTLAFHNNSRTFWQRHIVNPKFGFKKFIGLEEMPYSTSSDWPDDGILFSVGLDNFNKLKNSPSFLYFTTMYTHGPYEAQNDLGEASYRAKVETSISRLSYFIDEVYKEEPNTLIFIFGDHKPSLSEYFMKEDIFKSADLQDVARWDFVGDVPLFLKHPDSKRVQKVVSAANRLPFFCSIEAIDREFIGSNLPSLTYARQNGLCNNYSKKGYGYYSTAYPKWLYAISLFEKDPPKFGKAGKMSKAEFNRN